MYSNAYFFMLNSVALSHLNNAVFRLQTIPVNGKYKQSTGFFVNSNAVGVSVAHFLEGVKNTKDCILKYKGNTYEIQVLLRDDKSDVLVLKARDLENTPFLKLRQNAMVGEEVTVVGFNNINVFCTEKGYVLETEYTRIQDRTLYRCSFWAEPGMSGAPIVDSECNLIGMQKCVSGLYYKEYIHDSVAVPVRDIEPSLRKVKEFNN